MQKPLRASAEEGKKQVMRAFVCASSVEEILKGENQAEKFDQSRSPSRRRVSVKAMSVYCPAPCSSPSTALQKLCRKEPAYLAVQLAVTGSSDDSSSSNPPSRSPAKATCRG
jgi:hypothetical protein